MTWQRQTTIWIVGIVIVLAFLFLLRGILLPFLAGLALAYFLDPIADWMEEHGVGRTWATSIILGVFLLIFTLALVLLLPKLVGQLSAFISKLPQHVKVIGEMVDEAAPVWVREMVADENGSIEGSLKNIAAQAATWAGGVLKSILSQGLAFVNILSLLVITPIVAFYMLNDWDKMLTKVDSWLPREHLEEIRQIGRDVDAVLAGFVRGQGTVCLFLGVFYAVALSIVGLNFGLLIGLIAGFISFVPYVGSIVGLVISVGVALVQFLPDWIAIGIVAAIFVIGQFFEGNFLSPKLVGDKVGLHPVWLMFALLAFGYMFGFVGLLIAVPVSAAIGVVVRFGLDKYLKSTLYAGVPRKAAAKRRTPAKRASAKRPVAKRA